MKKLIIATAITLTASFTICATYNGAQPTTAKAKSVVYDNLKLDLSKNGGNRQDLGQADVE